MSQYIPGVCNIGRAEIRKRQQLGWIGIILTLLIGISLMIANTPHWWRILIAFPAAAGAAGFLQARFHFCAYFGLTALFNVDEARLTDTPSQSEFRQKDRKKAWLIIFLTILTTILITSIFYFL